MNAKEDALTKKVRSYDKELEHQRRHETQAKLFDSPTAKFKSTQELVVNNKSIVEHE